MNYTLVMLTTRAIQKSLPTLLRAVVRLCLRYGVKIGDVEDALKSIFISEAQILLKKNAAPISISKLSVMTGIQRFTISALLERKEQPSSMGHSCLMTKVVGAWQGREEFITKRREPRVLTVEGHDSEFAKLVRSVSQAVNPYTVLFEMERAAILERTERGVKLLASSFVVNKDAEAGLEFLSADMSDLVGAVTENLSQTDGTPHHHLTTEYDNISAEKTEEVRQLILQEGHQFHHKLRALLAPYDRDINPAKKTKAAVRVAICSVGHIEPFSAPEPT